MKTAFAILRVGLGLVYLWFGILKFFPGVSPAEYLAMKTLEVLFLDIISCRVSIVILAIWETLIGISMITGVFQKQVLYTALVHLALTFTPLIIFPEQCFSAPFAFTIVGQYIFKNVVLAGAILVLLKHARMAKT